MSKKISEKKPALVNPEAPDINDDNLEVVNDLEQGIKAEAVPESQVASVFKQFDQEAVDVSANSLEKAVQQMGRATGMKLDKGEKVKILVRTDPLNKDIDDCIVSINGWIYRIWRNKPVIVPFQVYKLLIEGGYNPTIVP